MSWNRYITGLVIFLTVSSLAHLERLSGFYIDNGIDQTIAHKVVSAKQKREIKSELINMLKLPEKPRRIVRKALLVKRSAPKFLLNVYQSIFSQAHDKLPLELYANDEEFSLSKQYINAIDESDFIMTFGAHNPHSGNASRINRGRRIWFDVSEVPRQDEIIGAEIWLFKSTIVADEFALYEKYRIEVYRVEKTKNGGHKKHYIDSTYTTINHEGWLTINITLTLQYWVKYPEENRGLFLAVHQADYTGRIMRPDDIGIIGVFGAPDKQPFMVSFFRSVTVTKKPTRNKRGVDEKNSRISNLGEKHSYPKYMIRKRQCSKRTLYVNFKDLEWQDWIIAPEGYDAFYCSGECNFPLNLHMNATNHAIVQTLVHLLKPEKVPKPCCAPTKLSPISVLYFLDDSNVVLKKYKNMVISSCGCH